MPSAQMHPKKICNNLFNLKNESVEDVQMIGKVSLTTVWKDKKYS